MRLNDKNNQSIKFLLNQMWQNQNRDLKALSNDANKQSKSSDAKRLHQCVEYSENYSITIDNYYYFSMKNELQKKNKMKINIIFI